MRQGLIRVCAISALSVVSLAPVATAGAAGKAGVPAARAAAATAPNRPLTWGDVAGRLRQQGRLRHGHSLLVAAARATSSVSGALTPTATAGAASTPTLTVTPSTGLKVGDRVDVTGAGFVAGDYALLECRTGDSDPGSCDLSEITDTEPDASGAFSTMVPVHRSLRLLDGRVDCATVGVGCDLVALDLRSGLAVIVARALLAFDASVPLPTPGLVATPTTQLVDGQQVAVHGTGWAPGSNVSVAQCVVASAFCSARFFEPITVGADGKFSSSFAVSLRANDDLGRLTNCIAAACELRVESFDAPDYFARASLAFDPSQPIPAPPVITVTPATGLHHDQDVQVRGSGFLPGTGLDITECQPSTFGSCDEYLDSLSTDPSGAFDVTVRVTRLLGSFDVPGPPPTPVDCASPGCSISASTYSSELALVAAAPIAFDASVPPPSLPTATLTPHSDLPYSALVAVHGAGFSPNASVYSIVCIESATLSSCGESYTSGASNGAGVADYSMAVRRRYRFGSSTTLDCTDPGTTCRVEVRGRRNWERVSIPITFDPNAPIPPPPAASIAPDHDLGYKQTVTLTGTNFGPGSVSVSQCGSFDTGNGGGTFCFGFDGLQADASGNVSGPIVVTRLLPFGPANNVDCAVAACFLQVGSADDQILTIPLLFDPNAPPPPPPSITVTPSTRVFDGQHVTVSGQHFTPGSQLGITECKAGVVAIADGCDIGRVRGLTVGADGSFSARFVTASVMGTSVGPVDCTSSATSCVIAAANAPVAQDFATAPISFAPPDLAVSGVGVREGTGGMTMAPVRVMLSKPDRNPITVHWVADAESASPGTDYTSMRGTLTIPAGETEAMIETEVVADAMHESTETFRVRVVDALGTHIVDRTGVVTIHDDDAAPSVSVYDTRRREDHGEAQAEVRLSAPSSRTVIVHYVTHHGSARAGSDYVRKDSRLIFLPGETRHLVRIALVNDRVPEPTETFQVEIDRVEQATIGRGVATITITDDD